MDEKLSIVPSYLLKDIGEKEVDSLIGKIIEESKNNMEEISELMLECTSLLASAGNRAAGLKNQKTFKRLIGNLTGKNQKLQNAILENNTNALYVAQETINRVMLECMNNRKLLLLVNDRVSDLYLELKENQNEIEDSLMVVRKTIVHFYKKYQEEILECTDRINRIENYEKKRCPKCQNEMFIDQLVCSYCGCIHPLKSGDVSLETKAILDKISEVVKDKSLSEDIVWDLTAQKSERVLRKIKTLAQMGKLSGYTTELDTDIENLIHKCKNAEFQIAVVGVMKAGKSFLMNALIGAEIASVEANPETAALTKFRSANGFHVIVRFQNKEQWKKLKESAKNSKRIGRDSLWNRLNNSNTKRLETKWIGHKELFIACKDLNDLQKQVKKFTSSQTTDHLFVSEVEVGVDKSIFNMPKEVVFVDTPGLKDPVPYRSNITKNYIKKADAVLIALKPDPLTAEGVEIITTVLDCTESNKAYIVGTQKDVKNEKECVKIVSNWIQHLMNTKRYKNERVLESRIILTSAKMELLINKWSLLSQGQKEDQNEKYFSHDDYSDLQSYYCKTINKSRAYLVNITDEECEKVSKATGISELRNKLEKTLIADYRKLKVDDINNQLKRCQKQVLKMCQNAIKQEKQSLELAMKGADELKKQIHDMNTGMEILRQENSKLNKSAEEMENMIRQKVKELEKKGE